MPSATLSASASGTIRNWEERYATIVPERSPGGHRLFQVACLGLLNAIDRFDFERGIAFSSYAVPTILGESSATSATAPGRCASRATSRSSR